MDKFYQKLAVVADQVIVHCETDRYVSFNADAIAEVYNLPLKIARIVEGVSRKALAFSQLSEAWYEYLGNSDTAQAKGLETMFDFRFQAAPEITLSSHVNVAMSEYDLKRLALALGKPLEKRTLGFVSSELPHFAFTDIDSPTTTRHEAQHVRNKFLMPERLVNPRSILHLMIAVFKDELVAQMTESMTYEGLADHLMAKDSGYDFVQKFLNDHFQVLASAMSGALESLRLGDECAWINFISRWGLMKFEAELRETGCTQSEDEFFHRTTRIFLDEGFLNPKDFEMFMRVAYLMLRAAVEIQEKTNRDITTLLAVTPVGDWGLLMKD